MSSFDVKPSGLSHSSSRMIQSGASLKSLSDEIKTLGNELREDIPQVYEPLLRLSENVLHQAAAMDTFADAIATIAELYQKTDGEIANALMEASRLSEASSIMTESKERFSDLMDNWKSTIESLRRRWKDFNEYIRKLLVELGLEKAREQTRVQGEEVTKWQEKEQNLFLRQSIHGLLKDDRFSQETWSQSSVEEREQILRSFIAEVAQIMGLPAPRITIDSESPDAEGYITAGYYTLQYNPEGQRDIWINRWLLDDQNAQRYGGSYSQMSTIIHEMRHYYQQYTTQHRDHYVVTEDTLNEWENSFNNYMGIEDFMREQNLSEEDAYDAYRNQTVEVDARWFAKQD